MVNKLNSTKLKIAVRVFAAMLLLLLAAPRILGFFALDNLLSYEPASLPLTTLFFFIIYALKPIILILPVNMLYVAAGLMFPAGWAVLITYAGVAIASSVGYINGKNLGECKMGEVLAKKNKLTGFLDSQRDNLPSLCFAVRLLPFPKDLFSMFFGAAGMPYIKFLAISLMGISPVMISNVLAGAHITSPLSREFLLPFGISLVIMLAGFAAYRVLSGKKA